MSSDQKCLRSIGERPEESIRHGVIDTLAKDHDHETGAIRVLICNRCDTTLGLLGDDLRIVSAAAQYLAKHKGVKKNKREMTNEEYAALEADGAAAMKRMGIVPDDNESEVENSDEG